MPTTLPADGALPAPASRPRLGFGELVGDGIDVLRRHFVPLAIPFIVMAIVTGAGQAQEQPAFDADNIDITNVNWVALVPFFAFLGLVALALVVVLFFAYSLVTVMTTRAALDAVEGREPRELGAQVKDAWPQILPATGTFALALLFLVLGFIALVVPGFIVMAALAPLCAVVAAERTAGMTAIRRAWALSRGHRWALFGIIVLTLLASGVVAAAVGWIPILGRVVAGAASGIASAYLAVIAAIYYRRVTAPPA